MPSILENLHKIQSSINNGPAPGQFEQIAFIIQGTGARYPISPYIRGIHLFEDIQSPFIKGWIDVSDEINLLQAGPLIGQELLELKFNTPGGDELENFSVDFTQNPLHIHSVQNLEFAPFRLMYRLHFCSPELLQNKRVRISKTYQGLVSDIIPDILTNIIGTKKKITIEPSIASRHYVVPNLHPFDFIRHLGEAAQAEPKLSPSWVPPISSKSFSPSEQVFMGRRSDYFFYEGVDGYTFAPISTPSLDGGLEFTIATSESQTSGQDNEGRADTPTTPQGYSSVMLRASAHTLKDVGDKYAGISKGTWCGTHIRHNGVTKSYKIYKSNYLEALENKKFSHISETPTYDPLNLMDPRNMSEWPKGYIRFSSSSSMADTGISKNNGHVFYPSQVATPTLALERQMQLGHLYGQVLNITLPGISGLRVGMGAYADMPNIGLGSGQKGLDGAKELAENRFTNFWIITKVSHHITSAPDAQYTCDVELVNSMSMTNDKLITYTDLPAPG